MRPYSQNRSPAVRFYGRAFFRPYVFLPEVNITMFKKFLSVFMLATVFSLSVFADQAAYISREDAVKASTFLKGKQKVTRYCAPCGTGVNETIMVRSVEAAPAKDNLWEVKVNEEGVDLAYLYYQMDNGRWKNVAIEIGLKVKDVPVYIPEKEPK
jgi:hypothetical protein